MDITKFKFELTVRLRRQTFSFGLLNFGTMILRAVWGLQRRGNGGRYAYGSKSTTQWGNFIHCCFGL